MKRIALTIALIGLCCSTAFASLSNSKIRLYARFLSDRMAYELDMNANQYEDCYEVNYDFLHAVNHLLDDMIYGYEDAIDAYYDCLDYRNDDLRYILSARQYNRFMDSEYFFRPLYSVGGDWALRIHTIYSNRDFYYFDAPLCYKSYNGIHSRRHYSTGFYAERHPHVDHHSTVITIHKSSDFERNRRNDFGENIRKRNGNKYDINNYNNRNQNNRTKDNRYVDRRNNRNSPEINKRSNGGNNNGNKAVTDNNRNDNNRNDNGNNNNGNNNRQRTADDNSNSSNGSSSRSNANVGRR